MPSAVAAAVLIALVAADGGCREEEARCGQEEEDAASAFVQVPVLAHFQGSKHSRASAFSALRPAPSALQWEEEPAAGEVSRGNLTVQLDPWDAQSPKLKLIVKMRFAKTQPAPLGPLLIHCGGPGSGADDCFEILPGKFDEVGYDVWSISQRGIAGSEPLMECRGAKLPEKGKTSYDISDFSDCPCVHVDGTPLVQDRMVNIDPQNETEVVNMLKLMQERGQRCHHWDKMQLVGANFKTYNLWEWSGTQLLAHDIDAFRQAIGAQKMSIYGTSYGTMVGGVYASVFPQNTNRVLLDGNVPPHPDKSAFAVGAAGGLQQGVAKLLYDCKRSPDCHMEDPEQEWEEILQATRSKEGLTALTDSGEPFRLTAGLLIGAVAAQLTSREGTGWTLAAKKLWALSPRQKNATLRSLTVAALLDEHCHVSYTPTWRVYGVCIGGGQLAESGSDSFIEMNAVLGQDSAGRWTLDDVLRGWRAINQQYGAVGSTVYLAQMSALYQWPAVPTPIAPIGNPSVPALISGNLYDPATRYSWAQEMHQAFPNGSMVTWQGVGHCMLGKIGLARKANMEAAQACFERFRNYFKTGELPPNGFTCRGMENSLDEE